MRIYLFIVVITMAFSQITHGQPTATSNDITAYINKGWNRLQRSMTECYSFYDPKMHNKSIVYIPIDLPMPVTLQDISQHCEIIVKRLPTKIHFLGEKNLDKLRPSGLLYLPHPYIVPGGMFNEMYGWDSYFIIRGLLEHHEINLAHGIIENFFFEIEHYGATLNGNRTYYLSRTQVPFLSLMVRAVYEYDLKHSVADPVWLAKAYDYVLRDYKLWTTPEHLAGHTGLSRYFDFGKGAVMELSEHTKSYYSDVMNYFLLRPKLADRYLKFNQSKEDKNALVKSIHNMSLTDEFYQGDRAMRESGFDISFRYGPFSADTINYAPLDLNSLLYQTEKNLAWMSKKLNKKSAERTWNRLAAIRQKNINKYLWDNKKGIFVDYNFKLNKKSDYPYVVTFYPLWVQLASPKQAKRVAKNLHLFERAGGLATSMQQTGVQWDYPYGWAPLQLIAIEGLKNYGLNKDAQRIANKFLDMVLENFNQDKTIKEKYNVVTRSTETDIKIGYKTNVIGFGWTNGVYSVLKNSYK